jgi:hypothetical protein
MPRAPKIRRMIRGFLLRAWTSRAGIRTIRFSLALLGAGSTAYGQPAAVPGKVLDPLGNAAEGARVRVQASESFVLSGPGGSFSLGAVERSVKVTAALPGYRIGYGILNPGDSSLEVRLKPLPPLDHVEYVWDRPATCSQCHVLLHQDWALSPHARAATDPVVLALYRGTRYDGEPSSGFGYRKAHPESYGDCARCHAPAFAALSADPDDPLEPHHDLDRALSQGTEAEKSGVTCDFCHKVRSVVADDQPPRVGRNLTLLRPPQFEPLMFGPFDDVTFVGMGAAYSPLHGQTSDLCSLCHWDSNAHGAAVGTTFREWQESPYAAEGKLCQDCHMKPDGKSNVFCLWEPVVRSPERIPSHTFQGADTGHLSEAVTLTVSAERKLGAEGLEVDVRVEVANTGAGHAVPTGITMRQAILVVEARRGSGFPLALLEGPQLPAWAGEGGPPESGYLAGLPGRGFAKITTDGATERIFDSEATAIALDTRIQALESDVSAYRFKMGGYRGGVEVRARVIHRRWWKDLEDERGFPDGDTVMAEQAVSVAGEPPEFLRGDTDGSGLLDLTDAISLLGHVFLGEPALLPCPDAADADDSGALDITDAITILGHLFLGAHAPPAPFPFPGIDPTPDDLGC